MAKRRKAKTIKLGVTGLRKTKVLGRTVWVKKTSRRKKA
jgi:hypothetical protein